MLSCLTYQSVPALDALFAYNNLNQQYIFQKLQYQHSLIEVEKDDLRIHFFVLDIHPLFK